MVSRLAALPVKHPSATLLFVQILGVLVYPLVDDTSAGRVLLGVVSLVVLGTALYVVKRGPWLTGFAVGLALPIVVLSIWLALDFDPRRLVVMAALEAAFYFYATGSLIAYMLEDEFATVDELFAAGATFTLLAWAWAYVFLVCQALVPGSFGALVGPGQPRTWMELLFLSFTTLSGVGLGDIIPLTPMARALVMIEEFSGVMYLATVDELFAAGATFTLLAWAFAYVFVVCQALLPGSFVAAASGQPRTWMELLFLSFTTLSGVGLGDIVPLLPMARALIMIEEFSGVMYLALVVSRLIGMSVASRTAR